MILELQHIESSNQSVSGAFLRGSDVRLWLLEIGRWNISTNDLGCYIIPQTVHSTEAAGLFVTFKNAEICKKLDLLEPYYCIAQKIFIPTDTKLYPEVTSEELNTILLWELQVFHPAIGLTGFEKKDQVHLAELFDYGQGLQTDWSFVHPGLPDRPLLMQIMVPQPSSAEIIDAIKESIDAKPLEDIPLKKDSSTTLLGKILDKIKLILFTLIYALITLLEKIFPRSNSSHQYNVYEGEGLLQKFQRWLSKNLEELQKKRDKEINRLLDMFDENTDEALQYAIPLDSPYLNRGTQAVSDSLSRNPFNFNLGKLGGGTVVDAWDLGSRYTDLRTKYINAAQKQIELKEFKKAAYVYAHLLGDYHNAANVLEQGNFHREAAALYKDHLKNIPAAASCLERGGLYIEAIELFKELQLDEKTADLYKKINQTSNADEYYKKAVVSKLNNSDYLDASRVINEKMNQPERAKVVLLDGWNNANQYEPCLKKFFDIVQVTEGDKTAEIVSAVYSKEAPRYKRPSLLNVLEYVNKKHADEAVKDKVQKVAFEIMHDEAEEGNVQILQSLKRFVPGDLLIGADANRYVTNRKKNTFEEEPSKSLHLDKNIKWLKAVSHRNQFLAVGIKKGNLHMARGNWYGNFEYYSWNSAIENYTRITFIHAPYHTNQIYLHTSGASTINKKDLPKNKYFTESLTVSCPIWLQKGAPVVAIGEDRDSYKLETIGENVTLHEYSVDGPLKRSTVIKFKDKKYNPSFYSTTSPLVYRDGYYYTFNEKQILLFSKKGNGFAFELETGIRYVAAPDQIHNLYLIISTNKGCYIAKPDKEQLNLNEQVFARDYIPNQIVFIGALRFVLAEKKRAVLFEIDSNNEPVVLQVYDTHNTIVGVLQGNDRNQFGLVEESGRVTICDIT